MSGVAGPLTQPQPPSKESESSQGRKQAPAKCLTSCLLLESLTVPESCSG